MKELTEKILEDLNNHKIFSQLNDAGMLLYEGFIPRVLSELKCRVGFDQVLDEDNFILAKRILIEESPKLYPVSHIERLATSGNDIICTDRGLYQKRSMMVIVDGARKLIVHIWTNPYGTTIKPDLMKELQEGTLTLRRLLEEDGAGFFDIPKKGETRYPAPYAKIDELKPDIDLSNIDAAALLMPFRSHLWRMNARNVDFPRIVDTDMFAFPEERD